MEIYAYFLQVFGKDQVANISSEESNRRYNNFKENLEKIRAHNSDPSNSSKFGINQYSDMSDEEFYEKMLKPNKMLKREFFKPTATTYDFKGFYETENLFDLSSAPPATSWKPINWNDKCGKVWNQGLCGCCYAFSTSNSIECNHNIKTGKLPQLSRQQIVDCNELTHGCSGGNALMVGVYTKSKGLMKDSDYPYKAAVSTCKFDQGKSDTTLIDGYEVLPDPFHNTGQANPFKVSYAVYKMLEKGTVIVSIDAGPIKQYKGGIETLRCAQSTHSVVVVGFAIDAKEGPYWLIKNSWDDWWGEKGYIRVKVKDDSTYNCFINEDPMRPFKN